MNRDQIIRFGVFGAHMTSAKVEYPEWENAWPIVDERGFVFSVFDSDDLNAEPDLIAVTWNGTRIVPCDASEADAFAYPDSVKRAQFLTEEDL